jgi:hypothetical protein
MSDADAKPIRSEAAVRRRAFLIAWVGITAFLALQNLVNVLTQLRDQPHLRPAEPWIWEYSSGLLIAALVPFQAWLLRRFAPSGRKGWPAFIAIAAAGSVAYSLVHVSGFLVIRKAIYALAGAHYGGADWIYEFRKDLMAYIGFGLILWLADQMALLVLRSRAQAPVGRLYTLKDGSRIVRIPMEEILAVSSARNYVEFHLKGGKKPLVRETLAKVEAQLSAQGFLRTHRSWLVNPAHVRAITPAAAGDFRLELETGLTAPLSRRFPGALEMLRGPEPGTALH